MPNGTNHDRIQELEKKLASMTQERDEWRRRANYEATRNAETGLENADITEACAKHFKQACQEREALAASEAKVKALEAEFPKIKPGAHLFPRIVPKKEPRERP